MADGTTPSPVAADPGATRSARAERSRAAIADAALELLREGHLRPTASQVADRAGISERLIYHHFTDLEELFQVVAARQVAAVQERNPPVLTSGPLDARVRALVDARADMNEWITPVRRASVVREPFSESLAANRAVLNAGSRRQVGEVFAPELGGAGTGRGRGAAHRPRPRPVVAGLGRPASPGLVGRPGPRAWSSAPSGPSSPPDPPHPLAHYVTTGVTN